MLRNQYQKLAYGFRVIAYILTFYVIAMFLLADRIWLSKIRATKEILTAERNAYEGLPKDLELDPEVVDKWTLAMYTGLRKEFGTGIFNRTDAARYLPYQKPDTGDPYEIDQHSKRFYKTLDNMLSRMVDAGVLERSEYDSDLYRFTGFGLSLDLTDLDLRYDGFGYVEYRLRSMQNEVEIKEREEQRRLETLQDMERSRQEHQHLLDQYKQLNQEEMLRVFPQFR